MKTVTKETIRDLLADGMEPTEKGRALLAALREIEVKRITKRHLGALGKAYGEEMYLRRQYGMVHLESHSYRCADLTGGISLLIGRGELLPDIDTAWIESENARYFAAAETRNRARCVALSDERALEATAEAVNAFNKAHAALEGLTAYDAPMHEIKYRVRALCAGEG